MPEALIAAAARLSGRGELVERLAGSLVADPSRLMALGWQPALAAREGLARLARETGGSCHFLRTTSELSGVYAQIEKELRAQYKIVYQSSNPGTDDAFRAVQVRLAKAGMEARTVSGYYP